MSGVEKPMKLQRNIEKSVSHVRTYKIAFIQETLLGVQARTKYFTNKKNELKVCDPHRTIC